MTPFEKAGYTKDSKFRVTKCESSIIKFKVGDILSIVSDDESVCPKFVNQEGYSNFFVLPESLEERFKSELIVEQEVSNNIYPNPPHKHAELIKCWADGAEIEYYDPNTGYWYSSSAPLWSYNVEYRVKPQKSDKDIQIEKLEVELEELETSVSKAWLDYNTSVLNLLQCRQELQEIKSNV